MAGEMMSKLTTMLGLVTLIALAAGAVVLANILLAAVGERRAEIGLQRALGATRRQIVQQFLVEGVVVTLAGGAAGVLLGTLVAFAMSRMQRVPAVVTWEPFALALLASVVVGLAVGAASAHTASLLGGWPVLVSGGAALRAMIASTLVALAFGAIPARRAASVDPATSLRSA